MTYINIPHQPQQGWECPKCGSVYSPTTVMCIKCPQQVTTTPGTGTPPQWVAQPYGKSPDLKWEDTYVTVSENDEIVTNNSEANSEPTLMSTIESITTNPIYKERRDQVKMDYDEWVRRTTEGFNDEENPFGDFS